MTVRKFIQDLLLEVLKEEMDEEILSIGAMSGTDKDYEYAMHLKNGNTLEIGKKEIINVDRN